jgi:hypothetical protein
MVPKEREIFFTDDITVQGFSVFLSCSSLKPESCLPYEAKGLLVSSREPACLFRVRTMRGRTADLFTNNCSGKLGVVSFRKASFSVGSSSRSITNRSCELPGEVIFTSLSDGQLSSIGDV